MKLPYGDGESFLIGPHWWDRQIKTEHGKKAHSGVPIREH